VKRRVLRHLENMRKLFSLSIIKNNTYVLPELDTIYRDKIMSFLKLTTLYTLLDLQPIICLYQHSTGLLY